MDVITLGTFNLLHRGHMILFKKCGELAGDGMVIVGLNTDDFVKKYKGKPPTMTYTERYDTIGETNMVDLVLPNDQKKGNAKDIILKSGAKLIVVGSDWAVKDYVGQLGINWDWLNRHGIGVAYVTYTPGISSTEIKARCAKQL